MENTTYFSKDSEEVSVELQNSDLWNKFHEHKTEMIVTKNGRRMFPFIRLKISGLDPTAYYCIILEFNLASNHRFKYYASTGWTPAGSEDKHHNQRVYVHPESPATGEHWMSQSISFGRAKLTNTVSPPSGLIVLSSMHLYQPTIVIVKTLDPHALAWVPTTKVAFPETQFMAVTAYQNEQVTKLKIEHNPFAKGFRETGQAKCKRKRQTEEFDVKKENNDSVYSTSSTSSSPALEHVENSVIESRPSHIPPPHRFYSSYNNYSFIPYNYIIPPHYVSNSFYNTNWNHYYETPSLYPLMKKEPSIPKSEVPKKLTDFSIRAITGL